MSPAKYVAREPDAHGVIDYPSAEHEVWNTLTTRQMKVIEGRACQNTSTASSNWLCHMTAFRNFRKSTAFWVRPPAGEWRGCRR